MIFCGYYWLSKRALVSISTEFQFLSNARWKCDITFPKRCSLPRCYRHVAALSADNVSQMRSKLCNDEPRGNNKRALKSHTSWLFLFPHFAMLSIQPYIIFTVHQIPIECLRQSHYQCLQREWMCVFMDRTPNICLQNTQQREAKSWGKKLSPTWESGIQKSIKLHTKFSVSYRILIAQMAYDAGIESSFMCLVV